MTTYNRGLALGAAAIAAVVAFAACSENLPIGPSTFTGGSLRLVTTRDTVVVGDSIVGLGQAVDAAGNLVGGLSFTWTSADSSIIGFATPAASDAEAVAGRARVLVAKRPGRAAVGVALPDPRFSNSAVARNLTAVVGGVRVLSSRDTILTAIGDTGRAIAAGLVRVNGALVTRASQGIRWVHLGSRVAVIGSGDTIRYVAQTNGVDTLIATSDLCLAGSKCADTVVARVAQVLTLSLSTKLFQSFSFGDSLGPTVTLADRRGVGQPGTSLRLVPLTPADSAIVRSTAPIGLADPSTGRQASPRLVSTGNGTARVAVRAFAADGVTLIATDTITEVVRQVARRVIVGPLRSILAIVDSIPISPVARDARNFPIADATVVVSPFGTTLHDVLWIGPNGPATIGTQATLTGVVTGIAAPENNPAAPQVPATSDVSTITLVQVDTVVAGTTQRTYSTLVLDTLGQPAVGVWVRVRAGGIRPDSVLTNGIGVATITWTPPSTAGHHTITAVMSAPSLATLADSAGRIVLRRSVEVTPSVADASLTTAGIAATTLATNATTTVTVTVRDEFGNIVTNATTAAVSFTATRGSFSGISCTGGVCTATYTAPATAGAATINVQINGIDVLNRPFTMTIT
jgi:hypothetical protein